MATVSCFSLPSVSWLPWQPTGSQSPTESHTCVVRCSLNSPLASPQTHWLTPAEWHRADRFYQPADRQRFVMGRSLLRYMAGQLSGQQPQDITLRLGQRGKPEWVNTAGWQVNIAHAGHWVLVALAPVLVGIDVEQISAELDYNQLLMTTFSIEEQAFINRHDRSRHAFYESWTRKEALLKATGLGITDHLPQLPVLTGTHTVADPYVGAAGHWSVASFEVDEHHPAAIAWAGQSTTSYLPVTCYSI